ncbi:hypothetical protein KVV02_001126 [Mortierella alpina]|uniref:Uncharacterized protein n=1 Tax=Mortierella alpina TaxID=64518 RepID=A0A9P7ZZ46_MORAP|nr:hypothetical protein KVV02_001126 [Mortierella alpina]
MEFTALKLTSGLSDVANAPMPHTFISFGHVMNSSYQQLCDWNRSLNSCKDAQFIMYLLVVSTVLHFIAGVFGIWLVSYRNGGFNTKMITGLFTRVVSGIQPKPLDCVTFFTAVACFLKIPSNLVLVFDRLQDATWLRIGLEQLYWVIVVVAYTTYFAGVLYAMPVTKCQGIFAVYEPESIVGSVPHSAIHVFYPSTGQKNVFLVAGLFCPVVLGAVPGIVSGLLYDRGHYDTSKTWLKIQYLGWSVMLSIMGSMFLYYGLKYTFILRANIIIAEAELKAPQAAFGIGNLKSRSPARYLFIMLQIVGYGGFAVLHFAGLLTLIWAVWRDGILSMENRAFSRFLAFMWTCAMATAMFTKMALIAVQSVRNRRRKFSSPLISETSNSLNPSSAAREQKGVDTRSLKPAAQDHSMPTTTPDIYYFNTQTHLDSEQHTVTEMALNDRKLSVLSGSQAEPVSESNVSFIKHHELSVGVGRSSWPLRTKWDDSAISNNGRVSIRESVFGRDGPEHPSPVITCGISLPSLAFYKKLRSTGNVKTGSRVSLPVKEEPEPPLSPLSPLTASMAPHAERLWQLRRETQQRLEQLQLEEPARPPTPELNSYREAHSLLRQKSDPEMWIPHDMKLRQQHPYHRVAFKGLAPPPRCPDRTSFSITRAPPLLSLAASHPKSVPESITSALNGSRS